LSQRTNQDPIAAVFFSSLAARIGRIKIGLPEDPALARSDRCWLDPIAKQTGEKKTKQESAAATRAIEGAPRA
jgi:hypothetical protein